MNSVLSDVPGLGLEVEGPFVYTDNGRPCSLTNRGEPLIAWVLDYVRKRYPALLPHVSAEQLACYGELKTAVMQRLEDLVEEIWKLRLEINRILQCGIKMGVVSPGVELHFLPVLSVPPPIIPASFDPHSRSYQLFERWGKTVEGAEQLRNTAIAAAQLNDSRVFHRVSEECLWKLTLALFNGYDVSQVGELCRHHNDGTIDHVGRTRMDILRTLLVGVKGDYFMKRGYQPQHVIHPPYFRSVADLQSWYCAHSGVPRFADVDAKDAHGVGIKVKLDQDHKPRVVEDRWLDATDDPKSLLQALEAAMALHDRIGESITAHERIRISN